MPDLPGSELAQSWSTRLGLAFTPLFGSQSDKVGQHFALLDGVEGSFALSTTSVDVRSGLDWAWSAQLDSHVQADADVVQVRHLDPQAPVLQFKRATVDQYLERFFQTLMDQRSAPSITVVEHIVACFRSHRHSAKAAGLSVDDSLTSFLELMDREIAPGKASLSSPKEPLGLLPKDYPERFREELMFSKLTGRHVDLTLTIRHAAGLLFQEAHAELTTQPIQEAMFGLAHVPRRSRATPLVPTTHLRVWLALSRTLR